MNVETLVAILSAVAALVGAGGGLSGLLALLRYRSENARVMVETRLLEQSITDQVLERANQVMDSQAREIERLRAEFEECKQEMARLRQEVADVKNGA